MRQRLPPEERRVQIVEAARMAIADRGLDAVSLRDIARAAGVAIGTVSYHFASVDDILIAVVEAETQRFYGDVVSAADRTDDPWQALELLMRPMFLNPDNAAHWRIWSSYWGFASRRPDLATRHDDRLRHWQHGASRVIGRGVDQGLMRCADPNLVALKIAAYADGVAAQMLQYADLKGDTAVEWLMEFAHALLD